MEAVLPCTELSLWVTWKCLKYNFVKKCIKSKMIQNKKILIWFFIKKYVNFPHHFLFSKWPQLLKQKVIQVKGNFWVTRLGTRLKIPDLEDLLPRLLQSPISSSMRKPQLFSKLVKFDQTRSNRSNRSKIIIARSTIFIF